MNVMSRETVLRQYVDSVKRDYDYVLLDCRPSLGMLVINALSASDYGRSWGLRWPSILVKSPWGSVSSMRTFFPSSARPAPRL